MNTSKQDRQGARTAADLERRYNFGRSFAEVKGIATDAQTHAYKAEEIAERVEKKYLNLDIVNELNVAAGTINLKSNGLVIKSDDFSLSAEDGIVATKGSFKGTVTATDGTFTGTVYAKSGVLENCIVKENCSILGTVSAKKISSYTNSVYHNTGEILYTESSSDSLAMQIDQESSVAKIYVSMGNGTAYDNYGTALSSMFAVDGSGSSHVTCSGGSVDIYGSSSISLNTFTVSSRGRLVTPHIDGTTSIWGSTGADALKILFDSVEYLRFMKESGKTFTLYADYGMALSSGSYTTSYLYGTWQTASGTVITSDKNAKNTISDLTEKYSTLFDSLRPVAFKYNDGQSGRLHTGFIAQEVAEAAETAGLSLDEFAGVCIEGKGTEKESWGVRYAEIVPLNTLEIQKLKRRVADLETIMKEKTYA